MASISPVPSTATASFPTSNSTMRADPQKKYLIDFWVMPVGGKLQVQETRIYKAPLLADGKWTTMARQPIPWWWIPPPSIPASWPPSAAGK